MLPANFAIQFIESYDCALRNLQNANVYLKYNNVQLVFRKRKSSR